MAYRNNDRRELQLYSDIQRAFEHIVSFAPEPITGERGEFLARLYESRMRSIFRLDPTEAGSATVSEFGEWFRDARATSVSDMIAGSLSDIWIGADSPDLFQESTELLDGYSDELEIVREYGLDCYATYLPIHFFFGPSRKQAEWGIYISELGMMRLAAVFERAFHRHFGAPHPDAPSRFVAMAYQVLLRHELEHFKIEAFALNAELYLRKGIYVPYLLDVYASLYPRHECLEEALANAAVLNSHVIDDVVRQMYPVNKHKGERIPPWQSVVAGEFFEHQPWCYRNYHLRYGYPEYAAWYNGYQELGEDSRHRMAMNFLCNQMMLATHDPESRMACEIPFYAFPPANFFLRAENLVPIHVVRYLRPEDTFIQTGPPSQNLWLRFLKALDYRQTRTTHGSHTIWSSEKGHLPVITVDFHDNQVDWGSFKTTLRSIGLTMEQFKRWATTGRFPEGFPA